MLEDTASWTVAALEAMNLLSNDNDDIVMPAEIDLGILPIGPPMAPPPLPPTPPPSVLGHAGDWPPVFLDHMLRCGCNGCRHRLRMGPEAEGTQTAPPPPPPRPPLTPAELQLIVALLAIVGNCWGSLTPERYRELFGVPDAQRTWGPRIFSGLRQYMQKWRTSHPQHNTINAYWNDGQWGWFWADHGGSVSRQMAQAELTATTQLGLQCYPCWYFVEGAWVRMMCFFLILSGSRLWWVHPSRITRSRF
jgi:hypothetical protein